MKASLRVSTWLDQFSAVRPETLRTLRPISGDDIPLIQARVRLIRSVLKCFLDRFGDAPVRVFRSPGRINLRGMHVDTHGGYLNLMTHQREVVAAVSPTPDDTHVFANIDPEFSEVRFRLQDEMAAGRFGGTWTDFINSPGVTVRVSKAKGDWGNYLKGASLRAQYAFSDTPLCGMQAVVGSDLPRGAALSSSHALCVVTLLSSLAVNARRLSAEELILAVRDAEWYTGARTGTSDPAAEILGGHNELVNVSMLAEDFSIADARRFTFPEALRILVINSYTQRNLSGAQLSAYTCNRFAYSMAMEILRRTLRDSGWDKKFVDRMDRLSRLTPEALGGATSIYKILQRIPERLSLAEIRARYRLPGLEQAYMQYFGNVPEKDRPKNIGLRGPLLYGLSESERARQFYAALESDDYVRAGRLMCIGHDGDRLVDASGAPFRRAVNDEILQCLAENNTPIEECPGDYGASSLVLDMLVDTALEAGALGASLTGAGIAGTVLALCRREDTDPVAAKIRNRMAAPKYAAMARRSQPLSQNELADAVVVNQAPSGAGELVLTA